MKHIALIVFLALAYIAVPLVFATNTYVMGIIVAALTIAGIAVSWAMLGNLGGMVSFGQAAFFGVGAYASALLVMKAGWPVFLAMPVAGLIASAASIVTMPALRLRGPYFALAMLAFAEIFRILATEMRWLTNGAGGILSIPRLPKIGAVDFGTPLGGYFVVLSLVLFSMLVYALVRRSPEGLALRAMHDSEDATRVVGVNATMLKALILLLAAFFAGMMGAFNAHYINFLEPEYAFNGSWTTLAIVAAIFGGYRTLWGPLAGAMVVYLVDQFLFKQILPSGHQLILGALLAVIVIFSPQGLLPWIRDRFTRGAAMLALDGVTVAFGGLVAVSDVSFSLAEKEVIGLVGPNGAGKTTLFNAVSGLVRPTKGTLSFAGHNLIGMPIHKRARIGLGRAFQVPQPMHELTVRENLIVAQRFGTGRVDAEKIAEILDITRLGHKADMDAATSLALTEQKALEVGKALATNPRLLMLDEVLAGLETAGKRAFMQTLDEARARFGLALLMVEHDIETISNTCPRVIVLNFGRLIADGTPDDVFRNPEVIRSYTGGEAA